MTRAEILDKAKECVCGQREQDYGKPEDNFAAIAVLWGAYKGTEFSAKDVAVMMALMKIARIKTGASTDDCFVDLAGYAACGGEIASVDKKGTARRDDSIVGLLYAINGVKKISNSVENHLETAIAVFSSFSGASTVARALNDVNATYGRVTFCDLNDCMGLPSTFRDSLWGWETNFYTKVTKMQDGMYALVAPVPTRLIFDKEDI